MNKPIFIRKNFESHSGLNLDWKIECDHLTDEDIETFTTLINQFTTFRSVVSVPSGGDRLAAALQKHTINHDNLPTLIVDDVLTSGNSIDSRRKELNLEPPNVIGVVIFSRGNHKKFPWVKPLFIASDFIN